MTCRTAVVASIVLIFTRCVSGSERAESANEARSGSQCEVLTNLALEIIHRYDRNGDGKLDRAEYGLWVAETERTTSTQIDADAGFKQLDRNSDGFIEVQYLARVPSREGGVPHSVPCH